MKQTAVEWLIETHFGSIENCTPDFRNKIKQAKEIEKQQIIDARVKKPLQSEWDEAEQYYNEQFKNK
jgi:hypothetical protein